MAAGTAGHYALASTLDESFRLLIGSSYRPKNAAQPATLTNIWMSSRFAIVHFAVFGNEIPEFPI
jgi:hypothetical protein